MLHYLKSKKHIIQFLLFLGILGIFGYILHDFYFDLLSGGILAMILVPLITKLKLNKFSLKVSSFLLILLTIIIFGAPLLLISDYLKKEITDLSLFLAHANKVGLARPDFLNKVPVFQDYFKNLWDSLLSKPGGISNLVKSATALMSFKAVLTTLPAWVFSHILHLVLSLLSTWVFMSNKTRIHQKLDKVFNAIAPEFAFVTTLVPSVIRSTASGLVSVALLEGVVLGVAYYLAGAPFPLILGLCTGYLALIPGGAPLSFTLVSALLLAKGLTLNAILLFSWGACELFLVDKFIRPVLIGKNTNMPFLAILFSLLGGISSLGPIGLFIGPVIMTIIYTIFEFNKDFTK